MTCRLIVSCACLVFALAAHSQIELKAQEPNPDWTIVPGRRVGGITATTSEAMLGTLFGREHVERADVEIGEGLTEPGTALYGSEATRRVEILWANETRTAPKEIRLTGESSLWKTLGGISLGSTLRDVERLNGGPFRLAGFGWDYGGTILDCGGGRLTMLGCLDPTDRKRRVHLRSIIVRFAPGPAARARTEYRQVLGDREFSSGHPAMQALNPRVYQLIVFLSPQ